MPHSVTRSNSPRAHPVFNSAVDFTEYLMNAPSLCQAWSEPILNVDYQHQLRDERVNAHEVKNLIARHKNRNFERNFRADSQSTEFGSDYSYEDSNPEA